MGYGSGGHNKRRTTAEACWKVDTAQLNRAGMIHPGTAMLGTIMFKTRALEIRVTPDNPGELRMALVVPKQGRHEQRVMLSFTDNHYGGASRAWFSCPLCRRRVFRLFYYDHTWNGPTQVHYLACRHCWRLTYNLRRERGLSKYQSQTAKASDKLKHWAALHGDWDYITDLKDLGWSELPPKPRWMRWHTYDKIATKFEDAAESSDGAFLSKMLSFLGEAP